MMTSSPYDFSLRWTTGRAWEGVALAAHGVPDALWWGRAMTHIPVHDRARGPAWRQADPDAALDSVTPAPSVVFGVGEQQDTGGVPSAWVTDPGPDFHTGWARGHLALTSTLDWSAAPKPVRMATIVGHQLHRYETDELANLTELRGLLKMVGLRMGPVIGAGHRYQDLQHAPAAPVVLRFPYAEPVKAELNTLLGRRRRVIDVELPIGLAGTIRWLKTIGTTLKVPEAKLDALIERRKAKLDQTRALLGHDRIRGSHFAVVADAPLAVGITAMLREFGFEVNLIAIRGSALGGAELLHERMKKDGLELTPNAKIMVDPSSRELSDALMQLTQQVEIDGLIGTSVELDMVRHQLSPRLTAQRTELFEVGYPSTHHHSAVAGPLFGFKGFAHFANRLINRTTAPRTGQEARPFNLHPTTEQDITNSPVSPETDKRLEDYALKGLHLAKMTGISLGAHAIKDGFLLQHVGVGCKYKAAAQVAQHDWATHPNRKEAWTQVGELSLIKGAGQRLGPFARSWYLRRRPGLMFVTSAYFIELTGEGIKEIVSDVAPTLPCPMAYIDTAAPNGGFFEGYAATVLEALKTLDLKQDWTAPRQISTAGFFFHRYEFDQKADLAQLRSLIERAGLEPGPMFFSGSRYEELAEAPKSRYVLQLPYLKPVAKRLKRVLKRREVVHSDLPMGLSGTKRFLTTLTAATKGNVDGVAGWADEQARRTQAALRNAGADRLHGLNVAVFAEGPWAAGLCSILMELGVNVKIVGIRERSLGGTAAFQAALHANGHALSDECAVWEQHSIRRIRQVVLPASLRGELDVVIGSTIELGPFRRAADIETSRSSVKLLETGYPCNLHHPAEPEPSFGYAGVLSWAQRLLEAIEPSRYPLSLPTQPQTTS